VSSYEVSTMEREFGGDPGDFNLTHQRQHVNTKRTTTRRHHMRYSPPIDEDDSPDEETLTKKMYSILSRLPNR
jgi:hypothetical protein